MIGQRVLLDTRTVLDLVSAPSRIAADVLDRLGDLTVGLMISAVSAWEIAIKTRQGKLAGGDRLLISWDQTLIGLQAEPLHIDAADAIRAGTLPWMHRDPFDRMLVAQAARHNVPIATRDDVILNAGLVATLDTRP